jgi:acyl-CoA thioester hydrolase
MSDRFSFEVIVEPQHIDVMGHMNHKVYVAIAEEAAIRHWGAVAAAEDKERYAWVASRIEIDFARESLEGETLTVDTWVGENRGARFERHVQVSGANGSVRAKAVTTWVIIDQTRQRPVRVPAHILETFAPTP